MPLSPPQSLIPVQSSAVSVAQVIFSVTGNTHDEYALVSAVTTPTETVVDLEDTHLNTEEQAQLKTLLTEFANILSSHSHDYGKT